MFVLGIQGSPRKKSNTETLLKWFLEAAADRGADTLMFDVGRKRVEPCRELIVCEKKGYCPIDDDMKHEVYPLLRRADVVVAATPIFFYNATAQLKALIDRSQTLWARKYRFRLQDPGDGMRRGFLLSVAATRGKTLFEGLELTARYFFDAVAASYDGSLTYRGIEHRGDMEKHPSARQEVEAAVDKLVEAFAGRSRVLFLSRKNDCRSQMAFAFARCRLGDRVEAFCAGSEPAEALDGAMVEVMAEAGVDMAFRRPVAIGEVLREGLPDRVVTLDGEPVPPELGNVPTTEWRLRATGDGTPGGLRAVRDEIEERVKRMARG